MRWKSARIVVVLAFVAATWFVPAAAQEPGSRPNAAPWVPDVRGFGGTASEGTIPATGINLQSGQQGPAAQPAASPASPASLPPATTQDPAISGAVPSQGNAPARTSQLTDEGAGTSWQPSAAPQADQATNQVPAAPPGPPAEITRVSKTFESLPSGAGQVWREYDILPYTSQVTGSDHPERAVVDWILRETGQDLWFHEPFGFLSASRDKLIVYHTPEIHNQVLPLVDRLNSARGQPQLVELGLYTVSNPNWRATALPAMQPVQLASPGVEAWLVSKENAARIIHQLSARADFRNQASGRAILHDGQQFTLARRNPDQFIRTIQWTPGQGPGYQPVLTQFDEGFDIAVSTLTSLDGKTIEAAIRCNVDQIEKKTNVAVPVTDASGLTQRINLQIPQIVSWRLEERVRWPVDQVLVLSCGVVTVPRGEAVNRPLGGLLDSMSSRADALLFLDYRGPTAERPDGTTASNQLTPIQPR
jgi:hypothetical protein